MGLLKKNSGREKVSYVAFFDVGSGSVASSVVRTERGKIPHIVWSKRFPISFSEHDHFEQLSKSMLATLLDSVLAAQPEIESALKGSKEKKSDIDGIVFTFTSPWYMIRSKVFTIEHKKDVDSVAITPQFINKLIDKEKADFIESIKSHTHIATEKTGDHRIVEEHIVQAILNGYPTVNLYEKKVKTAQVDLVLSAMSPDLYEKIQDLSRQLNPKLTPYIQTFVLTSFLIIRDLFPEVQNFLLIDIGAELTDISVVHKGTLIETTSIKYGYNNLIRDVAGFLNTIPAESQSLLHTYFAEGVSEKHKLKISNALAECRGTWVSKLQDVLSDISNNSALPRNVYLTTHNDFGTWFEDSIKGGDYSEVSFDECPFKVTLLDTKYFEEYCAYNRLTAQADPFLVMEALHHEKLRSSDKL